MVCTPLGGRKYCLPKKPKKPCNTNLGGLWVWSGWGDGTPWEWSCVCQYPHLAQGKGCKLNPNVCRGGTFNDHANDTLKRTPSSADCQCAKDHIKVVTYQDIPLCIEKNRHYCKNQKMCDDFYIN